MQIQYLSDLHLDASNMDWSKVVNTKSDIICLIGDISYQDQLLNLCLDRLSSSRPIILVPGNHEYDGHRLYERDAQIQEICDSYPNTHYLNNKSIILNGVKFIGTCLWSDLRTDWPKISLDEIQERVEVSIGHLKTIRTPTGAMNSKDIIALHEKAKDFIKYSLTHENENVLSKVVLTHFAPSKSSIALANSTLFNSYHVSSCEELIGLADYWLHGHLHDTSEYKVEDCQVLSNPRGYAKIFDLAQNIAFSHSKTVQVPSLLNNPSAAKKNKP